MQQTMENIIRREGGHSGSVVKDTDGFSYGEFSTHHTNVMAMLNDTGYAKHFQGMAVNSPEFNKQFESLKSPEFSKAQRDWWTKNYFDPAVNFMPSLVQKSPVVAEVISDTFNQYGQGLGKKIINGAIAGIDPSNLDPSDFIKLVQDYKRINLKDNFKSYLKQHPNNEQGLWNRINDSEAKWLKMASEDKAILDATGSLPHREGETQEVGELVDKINTQEYIATATVGRKIGIDPLVHQQFLRPQDVNAPASLPTNDSYGLIEGFWKGGVRQSWAMGLADKMSNRGTNVFGSDVEVSYDQLMSISQEFGGNIDKALAAVNWSNSEESLKKNIELIKYNDEVRRKLGNSAWYVKGAAMIGEGAASPDTYVPFMAGTVKGAMAMGAVGGALTTHFSNRNLGTNDDIFISAVTGGVAGGTLFKGFEYLGRGASRLGRFSDQTTMRANLIAMGKEVPDDFGGSQRLAVQLNRVRQKLEQIAPNKSLSTLSALMKAPAGRLKDFSEKMFAHEGQGYIDPVTGKAQRVKSDLPTMDEIARNRDDAINYVKDRYSLGWESARAGGITKDDYGRAFVDAMEGKLENVPKILKENKDFMDAVKRAHEELGSENYFPTQVSNNKMTDRINELVKTRGVSVGEAKDIIKAEIKADLLKSLNDEKSFAKLREWYQKNVEAELKAQHEARIAEAKARAERHNTKESKSLTNNEKAEGKVLDHEVNRAEREIDRLNKNIEKDEYRTSKEHDKLIEESQKKLDDIESKYDKLEQKVDKANSDIDKAEIDAYNRITDTYQKNRKLAKTKTEAKALEKRYLRDLGRFEKGTLKRLKAMRRLKDELKRKKAQEIKKVNQEFDRKFKAISKASDQRIKDFINTAKDVAKRIGAEIVSSYNKGQRRENQSLLKMIRRDNNIPEPYVPKTDDEIRKYFLSKAGEDANGYVEGGRGFTLEAEHQDGLKGVASPIDYHETKIPWNHSLGTNRTSVRNNSVNPMTALENRLTVKYGEDFLKSRGYIDKDGNGSQAMFIEDLKKMYAEAQNASRGEVNFNDLQKAVDLLPKIIFNKLGTQHDADGYLAGTVDIIRNLAFMTKNSYMGLMNLFEQAEAVKAYGAWHIIKSIPAVNEVLARWGSGDIKPSEAKALQSYLYGQRVRNHELFRDIRDESLERQAQRFKGKKMFGAVVGWSETLAYTNPFTKFLRSTENNIILSAQDSFTGELVRYTFTRDTGYKGETYKSGFLTRKMMERNNISERDMNELMGAIRDNVTWNNKDGSWSMSTEQAQNLKNNYRNAFANLRRMGDYVAQEVIQRNNLGDTNLWAGSAHNPIMNMLFQFKTFAMRSYNKRIVKSMQRAAEGDEFGQALTVMIGTALGAVSSIAQTGLQTLGMTEEQREKFLEKVYGSTDWKNDSGLILAQGALNGAMRSSIFASAGLVTGALGINPQIRSTNTVQYGTQGFGDWLVNNVPAFSSLDTLVRGGQAAYASVSAEDDDIRDRKLRQFFNSLGRFTNIPVLSKALPNWFNGEY